MFVRVSFTRQNVRFVGLLGHFIGKIRQKQGLFLKNILLFLKKVLLLHEINKKDFPQHNICQLRMNEVYSIECTNMPAALDENKIFFVEREYEWYINQYIGRNSKRFAKAFANFQYSFGYFPESKDVTLCLIANQLLKASNDINHALCKFAYMEDGRAVFYCVELDNDEVEESLAKQFYHFACWCKVATERRAKWLKVEEENAARRSETDVDACWVRNERKRPHVQIVNDIDGLEQLEEYFEDMEVVEECKSVSSVDVTLADIKRQLDELRAQGVSEERIREAIEPTPEISRLAITKDYHILLPDLHKELSLPPLQKALFLLFLRHPKGINFKRISEYKDELYAIYIAVSERVSKLTIDNSIERICTPSDNSIHEKCANIRRALILQLGDRLGLKYCITGLRGEPKRIALPEELVSWEK